MADPWQTPEQVMATQKVVPLVPNESPPLSDMDRTITGKASVRVDLPFVDSYKVRKMGELLCGLGEMLKALSHRHDLTERQRLFIMASETRDLRNRIRYLHSKINKNGTFSDGLKRQSKE